MNLPEAESRVCEQCGAPIGRHAASGLCSICVARFSLLEEEEAGEEPEAQPPEPLAPSPRPGSGVPESGSSRPDLRPGLWVGDLQPSRGEAKSEAVPPPRQAKTRFGDYELLEEIAHGGMGVVYQARQISLDRLVAVKMLLFGQFAGKAASDRFRAEAQTVALLQHPNIVAIHEIGETEGQPYFSMDYVAGRNLAELVRDRPLPAHQAAAYVRTIARAVQYAHSRGVLHRDLKPANVLIDEWDEPRITDFGLARRLAGDSELTLTGQVLGSPNFMPPEQGAGKRAQIGPASDVYGLGALLYYLLTARPPFAAETFEATLAQVLTLEPVAPRRLNPGVPRDLETLCLKCLEKDPARRCGSAGELADELDRFLRGEPIQARPMGRAGRAWRWCRRNPRLATATTAAVLSLLLGLAGVTWQWRLAEKQRARAEAGALTLRRSNYAADMTLVQRSLQQGKLGNALRFLERNRPQPGEVDFRHWEWRYLWERTRSDALFTFCQHSNAVWALGFVNDGQWLAAADMDGAVRLWDVAGRREVARLQDTGAGWCMAVSRDGKRLAVGGMDQRDLGVVRVWEVATGRLLAQIPLLGMVRSVAFSRDGSQLLLWEHDGYVRLWDVVQQRLIANVVPAPRRSRHGAVVLFSPDDRQLVIGDGQGTIRFFDRTGTHCTRSIKAHPHSITALAFRPDGTLLASAGTYSEGIIRLWDPQTGLEAGQLRGYLGWVSSLVFWPDGKTLVSCSSDSTVRLWDVASRSEIAALQGHLGGVGAVALSPDCRMLVSGDEMGSVLAWPAQPAPRRPAVVTFPSKKGWESLAFSPDSESLAALTPDGGVMQRPTANLEEGLRLGALGTNNSAVAYAPSGRFLVAGNALGQVRIWDLAESALAASLNCHTGAIEFVRFAVGDHTLVVVDQTKVQLWTGPGWRESSSWALPDAFSSVAISRDGQRLAVAQNNRLATVWNLATGQRLHVLRGHKDRVMAVAFSPDGRFLLACSNDGTVRLWELGTSRVQELLRQRFGHSVAFSHDGQRLAIGAAGFEAVTLFDAVNLQETATLAGKGDFFLGVCFSPDGRFIASSTFEGPASVWRAPSWAEIEAAKRTDRQVR